MTREEMRTSLGRTPFWKDAPDDEIERQLDRMEAFQAEVGTDDPMVAFALVPHLIDDYIAEHLADDIAAGDLSPEETMILSLARAMQDAAAMAAAGDPAGMAAIELLGRALGLTPE